MFKFLLRCIQSATSPCPKRSVSIQAARISHSVQHSIAHCATIFQHIVCKSTTLPYFCGPTVHPLCACPVHATVSWWIQATELHDSRHLVHETSNHHNTGKSRQYIRKHSRKGTTPVPQGCGAWWAFAASPKRPTVAVCTSQRCPPMQGVQAMLP
jgi:hypothetical protein